MPSEKDGSMIFMLVGLQRHTRTVWKYMLVILALFFFSHVKLVWKHLLLKEQGVQPVAVHIVKSCLQSTVMFPAYAEKSCDLSQKLCWSL